MHTILHFEGIPGSGKSTASERLCTLLNARGIDAFWSLEESADHPVMPKERRQLSHQADFPEVCLNAWRSFVETNDRVAILDGYALQSTVRFLYSNLTPIDEIRAYFKDWVHIGKGQSFMTFFAVENPAEHYEIALPERGKGWTEKLYAYVENTPFGKANHLCGRSGFIEFWSRYQELCLDLVQSSELSLRLMPSRSWVDDDLAP